jgi:hypothetical protein
MSISGKKVEDVQILRPRSPDMYYSFFELAQKKYFGIPKFELLKFSYL